MSQLGPVVGAVAEPVPDRVVEVIEQLAGLLINRSRTTRGLISRGHLVIIVATETGISRSLSPKKPRSQLCSGFPGSSQMHPAFKVS